MDSPKRWSSRSGERLRRRAPAPFAELAAAFPVRCWPAARRRADRRHREVSDAEISLAVARFERTTLQRAMVEVNGPDDSRSAGAQLAARPPEGRAPCSTLRRLACVNGTALVEGLASGLPAGVAITGSPGRRRQPLQHLGPRRCAATSSSASAAIGLYGGHLQVSHGCDGGWSDFGPRGASRARSATCSTSSTVSRRWTCTGPTSASVPTACPAPHCCSRSRSSGPARRVRRWCARSSASTGPALDDLRRRHARSAVARLMRTSNDRLIDSASHAAAQSRAASAAASLRS